MDEVIPIEVGDKHEGDLERVSRRKLPNDLQQGTITVTSGSSYGTAHTGETYFKTRKSDLKIKK